MKTRYRSEARPFIEKHHDATYFVHDPKLPSILGPFWYYTDAAAAWVTAWAEEDEANNDQK